MQDNQQQQEQQQQQQQQQQQYPPQFFMGKNKQNPQHNSNKSFSGVNNGNLNGGTRSQASMSSLLSPSRQQHTLPRIQSNKEEVIHHLVSPTKSLQLRAIVSQEQRQILSLRYLKNSRILDNHFLKKIHGGPWISPGLFRRGEYESDQTGVAFVFPDNSFEGKLKVDRQEISKLKESGFRYWSEYDKIRENEHVITLEYCTNCAQHQNTTRHDEKKYESIALNLKKEIFKHFPTVKVYMKPLITEQSEQTIDNQFARSRLGAMEVQFCTVKDGKMKSDIIFSKLKTKRWPTTLEVLNELRKYMDKCTLNLHLIHEYFNPADLPPEKKNTSENKLLNVEILLKPIRRIASATYSNLNQSTYSVQQNNSQHLLAENSKFDTVSSKDRPNSGIKRSFITRPTSGQSVGTVQSYSRIQPRDRPMSSSGQGIEIRERSNQDGVVVFKNLPLDAYTIEIKETNDYRAARDKIDLFKKSKESNTASQIDYEIRLEHVDFAFAKIYLDEFPNQDAKNKESLIRVFKEGEEDNELDGKIVKEFDATLDPGVYTIIVENQSCGQIKKQHEFQFGNQELFLSWSEATEIDHSGQNSTSTSNQAQQQKQQRLSSARPQSGVQKELKIVVHEALNQKKVVSGCKIEIIDQSKGKSEYQSDIRGSCTLQIEGLTKGILKITHNAMNYYFQDYIQVSKEYGPNSININKIKLLPISLLPKLDSDNEANILISAASDQKVVSLQIILPDGTSTAVSQKNIVVDNNQDGGPIIKITKTKEVKGVYRIFAKVRDLSLLNPQLVRLFVISSADVMNEIEVPKNHPTLPSGDIFWDIGAFITPECQFVEINSVQSQPITLFQNLVELKQIGQFIQSIKKDSSTSLRDVLGFPEGQHVMQQNNDLLAAPTQVRQAISQSVFQNKNVNKNIENSLQHIIDSALFSNGLVSFNKLRSKLETISFPDGINLPEENLSRGFEDEDGEDEPI